MLFIAGIGMLMEDDCNLNQIFKLDKESGVVTVYAGTVEEGDDDGPALQASFHDPVDLALLSDGSVIVADRMNNLIRLISPPSAKIRMVTTLAGNRDNGFLDGPTLSAAFYSPRSLCVDKNDTIYIYDDRIRCLSLD